MIKKKRLMIVSIVFLVLVLFFILSNTLSPDKKTENKEWFEKLGSYLPLPIFTFFIALVDGFNPCNLFILTLLVSLLLSESHSRKRIYIVGFTFIAVVYIFYFSFMALWLNIFKYIGFISPLRITIALLAIIAGLINCKEMFFYRKGITLMVQDKHVGPLKAKIQGMAGIIKNAPIPTLIGSSIMLAIFSSLVELPCTAGFPIIYTSILTGTILKSSFLYYAYLMLYTLIYVLPLIVIITIFGYTFRGKQISKETMALIKFIGGAIMLLLGLVLMFMPGLIGL